MLLDVYLHLPRGWASHFRMHVGSEQSDRLMLSMLGQENHVRAPDASQHHIRSSFEDCDKLAKQLQSSVFKGKLLSMHTGIDNPGSFFTAALRNHSLRYISFWSISLAIDRIIFVSQFPIFYTYV